MRHHRDFIFNLRPVKLKAMSNFSFLIMTYFVVFTATFFSSGLAENPEETGNAFEGDILGVAPSLLRANTRSGLLDEYYRWPNAIIPFEIAPGYNKYHLMLLEDAMLEISIDTCVRFVPRTNEPDYISIEARSGCYSYVGRIGGKQTVSLPMQCKYVGTFIHELMHAIGFFHEQSRSDRDDYVTINHENIRPGQEHNFVKYGASVVSDFGVAYDYDSLMHYSATAFSKNGRDTIVPKRAGVRIGHRQWMSQGDAEKINNMYCKNGARTTERPRRLQLF